MVSTTVFMLMVRLFVSLAVVLGLMVLLAAALRKRGIVVGNGGARRARAPMQIDVLARRALGRNAHVAIVRAGTQTLVLGVTDHQVTMLTETSADANDFGDELEVMTGEPQGTGFRATTNRGSRGDTAWRAMLDTVRERTVRR